MMNSINLHIKLNSADIKTTTCISPYSNVDESLGGENKHYRASFIEISGTVKDLTGRQDLIVFSDAQTNEIDFHNQDVAKEIRITIKMTADDSLELYRELVLFVHEGILIVENLNFGIEQFNQIKSILDDKFTTICLGLHKRLNTQEIKENLNKKEILPWGRDYGDIDYIHTSKTINDEKNDILHIKHNTSEIKITHFSISSSKPKYVTNDKWLDDVWSVKHNVEKNSDEKLLLDEINENTENFPKQIFEKLKDTNSTMVIIIILLIILLFKVW